MLKRLEHLMQRLKEGNEGPDAVDIDYACDDETRDDPTHGTDCVKLGEGHCFYSDHPHQRCCRRHLQVDSIYE